MANNRRRSSGSDWRCRSLWS